MQLRTSGGSVSSVAVRDVFDFVTNWSVGCGSCPGDGSMMIDMPAPDSEREMRSRCGWTGQKDVGTDEIEGSVQAGTEFCRSSSGGSPAGLQMALAASASATREREACSGSARRWARENVVWRIRWPPDMEGKLAPASTPGSSAMRLCSKVPVELTACAESSFHQHTPSSTSQLSQTSISTYLAWHGGSTPRILRVGHPTQGSCGWLATYLHAGALASAALPRARTIRNF